MIDIEIKEKIASLASIPVEMLDDNELLTDLLVDSFAIVDLSIAIQEELDVIFSQQDLIRLDTVGDLITLVKRSGWASLAIGA